MAKKVSTSTTKVPAEPSLDGLNEPLDLEEVAEEEAKLDAPPPPPPEVKGPTVEEEEKNPVPESNIKRFDYVKFSPHAESVCGTARKMFEDIELMINTELPDGRYKSMALSDLEQSYSWIGKACRSL